MYGHNGEINSCGFSEKGDYFVTGGSDCNILIWASGFEKKKGESIKSYELGEEENRKDQRTLTKKPDCLKKTSKIPPSI
jgi:WD40 repeat protein